jgi:2-amino-4-hydroxy-6-hydroxymethyldihydropteridine diphosphokinase
VRYFIGLGANLGDRLATLRQAVCALEELGPVVARSRVYASTAVGGPPQPSYLNAAIVLECELEPMALLGRTQQIEESLGRNRDDEVRWGPRCVDIDLLLAGAYGELRVEEPGLTLPHPRMHERGFALAPLLDLDAALIHPQLDRPLKALIAPAHAAGQQWAPTGDPL